METKNEINLREQAISELKANNQLKYTKRIKEKLELIQQKIEEIKSIETEISKLEQDYKDGKGIEITDNTTKSFYNTLVSNAAGLYYTTSN